MSHMKSYEYRSLPKSRFWCIFSAFDKLKIDVEILYHLSPMNCWIFKLFIDTRRDRRNTFGKRNKKILENWIRNHEEFSYPAQEDLEYLEQMTGLTEKQIRVWFTNHRNVSLVSLI